MKQLLSIPLLCLAAATAWAGPVNPTVVTFEEVGPSGNVPEGYGGISGWSSAGNVMNGTGEGIGDYLFYGQSGDITFDNAPVNFLGTFYKAYAVTPGTTLTGIALYFQNQLVHSILDPQAALGLVWVDSGYAGLVDRIHFEGGGEGYAIDNLSYSVANVGTVPEPGTSLLLISALGLLGLGAKRRKPV